MANPPYLAITIPFETWLMLVIINYFPKEIQESAIIERANHFQRFTNIIVSIITPGTISLAILNVFLSWNEFLIASNVKRRKANVLSMSLFRCY